MLIRENIIFGNTSQLLTFSVTLNIAVLVYVFIVRILDPPEDLKSSSQKEEKSKRKLPKVLKQQSQQSRRIAKSCLSLMFSLLLTAAGFYLFTDTNISTNPFFAFNRSFEVVFVIQIAFYVFSISWRLFGSENIFEYLHELLHHTVAIALYISILSSGGNCILGLIGLFMNGNLIFYEVKTMMKIANPTKWTLAYKSTVFLHATSTCILRIIFPLILLAVPLYYSITALFLMDNISLAFFFLSVIFFSIYNIWYVKQTLSKCFKEIELPVKMDNNAKNIGDFAWDGCDVKVNTWGSALKVNKERCSAKKSVLWDGNLTKNSRLENEYVPWTPMSSSFTNKTFDPKNVFVDVELDAASEKKIPNSQSI